MVTMDRQARQEFRDIWDHQVRNVRKVHPGQQEQQEEQASGTARTTWCKVYKAWMDQMVKRLI
jgi:hypothetical protein